MSFKNRIDNSSFIKSLNDDNKSSENNSPKEKTSRNNSYNRSNHHHHSVHEMIKHLGKKVHIWPSRRRHESTSVITSPVATPLNDPQENFRVRSKSLDVKPTNKILSDCDATYKIYEKILREGDIFYQLYTNSNSFYSKNIRGSYEYV